MEIDNTPVADNPQDTGIQQASQQNQTIVTHTADADTALVAANIADIKAVAASINSILTQTKAFNDNIVKLETTSAVNGKNIIQTLEDTSNTFTSNVINDINTVATISTEVSQVATLKDMIPKLVAMEQLLTAINANLATYSAVAQMSNSISVVNNLQASINQVVAIEAEILKLSAHMDELQTIFNYLQELLIIYSWIVKYKEVQNKEGFTDEAFYHAMLDIVANIQALLAIHKNMAGLLEIKQMLEDAPTLIEDLKKQLEELKTTYSQNITDLFNKYKAELTLWMQQQKAEVINLLNNMKGGTNIFIDQVDTSRVISTLDFLAGEGLEVLVDTAKRNATFALSAETIQKLADIQQSITNITTNITKIESLSLIAGHGVTITETFNNDGSKNYTIAVDDAQLVDLDTYKKELQLLVADTKIAISDMLLKLEYYVNHLHAGGTGTGGLTLNSFIQGANIVLVKDEVNQTITINSTGKADGTTGKTLIAGRGISITDDNVNNTQTIDSTAWDLIAGDGIEFVDDTTAGKRSKTIKATVKEVDLSTALVAGTNIEITKDQTQNIWTVTNTMQEYKKKVNYYTDATTLGESLELITNTFTTKELALANNDINNKGVMTIAPGILMLGQGGSYISVETGITTQPDGQQSYWNTDFDNIVAGW